MVHQYIHHLLSILFNCPVNIFNVWWKYLYRSRAQVFRAGKRWGLIGNSIRLRCFYVSTYYNWIWYFQWSRIALALHSSYKILGILSYDAILYIYFLQTTRKTQRRCCSMQNVRIVNLIRSKPSVIVTSLSFNHISNKLAILMTLSIGNQLVQLVQVQ